MIRFATNFATALIAVFLATATIVPVVTVPAAETGAAFTPELA